MTDRVIALVDMDCFYCQVEERLNPETKGKPSVVVQYNPWKGGGIIAVNYEARAQGVKRGMRGAQAKQLCPDVILCSVPMIREKADLTRYRNAGKEVLDVMCKFSECVQRASIDEAYLDLTNVVNKRFPEFRSSLHPNKIENTFVVGYSSDFSNDEVERCEGTGSWLKDLYQSGLDDEHAKKLAVGAVIVEEMRKSILEITGFKCSAGIAHNKILAKLAAGIHKPNRQTILPHASVAGLYSSLPVHKIRNLGGKLGRELEDVHGVKMMADLLKFSQAELVKLCEERMGNWLYHIARGFDDEPVEARLVSKSIACCKNFPGRMSLSRGKEVEHWLNKLTEELLERLLEDETMNQRRAQHMVFSIRVQEVVGRRREVGSSKSVPLSGYSHEKIVNSARTCLKKFCSQDPNTQVWSPTITFLGISAGKFVDTSNKLKQLFSNMQTNRSVRTQKTNEVTEEPVRLEDDLEHTEKQVTTMPDEIGVSKYFQNIKASPMDIDDQRSEIPNKRKCSSDGPTLSESLNQSSMEESAGPSFFERMLLDDVSKNGKRIKLNVLPVVPQPSPGKLEDKLPDISANAVTEAKSKSSRINDFFNAQVPRDKNYGNTVEPKEPTTSFFAKNAPNWVDPTEIFPDVESIDEGTLALFPLAYQKKILEMKRAKAEERKHLDSKDCAGPSNEVCGILEKNELLPSGVVSRISHKSSNQKTIFKPPDDTECVPSFNTRPPSCCSKKLVPGASTTKIGEDSSDSSDVGGTSNFLGNVSNSRCAFVPKQSQRCRIPVSQEPSTSKCGLEDEAKGLRFQSSPEDIFDEVPVNEKVPFSNFGRSFEGSSDSLDDPKSSKTDAAITKELGKYTIHDSQVPSTSKCGVEPTLNGSPEDIFAQNWPPYSARANSPSPSALWRGPSPISDDSNDRIFPRVSCPECQVLLQPDEVDEHADFHFALKLQNEMNQLATPRPIATPSNPAKPVKRKALPKSSKKPESKKMKSIDSFFKKAS